MFKKLILLLLISLLIISCETHNKNLKLSNKTENYSFKSIKLGGVFHKIKLGESLWGISQAYNIPLEDIIEINDLNPNSILYPGDEIFIPNVKEKITKPITRKKETEMENKNNLKYKKLIIKKHKLSYNKNLVLNKKYLNSMNWPVNGVVITDYGKNGELKSDGMDIAAPLGTKVVSVLSGIVIYSGSQPGYGNIIIIKHSDKLITIYAHNNKNLVKKGQKIKKSQKIATVGNSGNAQRYQLHFEMRKGVKAINPNPYLIKD